MIALPALTCVSGALGHFFPSRVFFDWPFMVSLSGTVGLWTNHFAIRMLFRPHRRTVFGRQGLIPAKRDELARAVGEAVANRLLDTDSVLDYLEQNGLLEKGAHTAVDHLHRLLTGRKVRAAAAGYLQKVTVDILEAHSGALIRKVQEFITELIRERTAAGSVWPRVREAVRQELANPVTREAVVRSLLALADRNSAAVSAMVNNVLEEYISSKRFLERVFLGLGKKVLRVDEELLIREIRRKVRSPGFFDEVLAFLDANTEEIQSWIDSPGFRSWFQGKLDDLRESVSQWARTEGVELGVLKVRSLLASDGLWNWVSSQLDGQVASLAAMARRRILSPEFRLAARKFAGRAASGINVKGIVQARVNQLDLNELEELVLDVSGGNLAAIELFGALLGCLAGVILIDVRFLPLLPATVLAFLLVEKALTALSRKGPLPVQARSSTEP